jgi:hypothetical protein
MLPVRGRPTLRPAGPAANLPGALREPPDNLVELLAVPLTEVDFIIPAV